MKQNSQATRMREYINSVVPDAHGHQQKVIAHFVTALMAVQSCRQATLAREGENFEAASKRLSRYLHNERIEEDETARCPARCFVAMLPPSGRQPLRLTLDWTSEGEQHLLVASVRFGRRAVPLYWHGFETTDLKARLGEYERVFVRELFTEVLEKMARRLFMFTADRGFADVDLMDLLNELGLSFIIRTKLSHKVLVAEQWVKIANLPWPKKQQRRTWGQLWYCESNPRRVHFCQARTKDKEGNWHIWNLVSNRPLSAKKMSAEYGCRFSGEEGFRDGKRLLGFAEARISSIAAWQRMFLLVAIALLLLARLGCGLLQHEKKDEWLRQIRSRRTTRSEVSLVYAVIEILKKEPELWEILNKELKINLNAKL